MRMTISAVYIPDPMELIEELERSQCPDGLIKAVKQHTRLLQVSEIVLRDQAEISGLQLDLTKAALTAQMKEALIEDVKPRIEIVKFDPTPEGESTP